LVLWLTAASIASAQDVMELDLAFKNGLLQGHDSGARPEVDTHQLRRHDTRDALRRVEVKKRHVRRRRGR